jgi:DNA-binding response OmpR family regulator
VPKLLVVDDDEQYRTLVRRMLEDDGHRVLDAATAAAGYEIFEAVALDAVITDILMPETDGIELITRMRREKPGVPIIAISGGGKCPPELYLSSSQYLGATRTLSKPFRRDELLEAVNAVLAGVPPDSD